MPTAAAEPDRMAVGRAQNVDWAHMIAIAAKVIAARPNTPEIPGNTLAENATNASMPASARCQRRSPVRSEWWAKTTMTIAAAAQGIAETSPIFQGFLVSVSLMI